MDMFYSLDSHSNICWLLAIFVMTFPFEYYIFQYLYLFLILLCILNTDDLYWDQSIWIIFKKQNVLLDLLNPLSDFIGLIFFSIHLGLKIIHFK